MIDYNSLLQEYAELEEASKSIEEKKKILKEEIRLEMLKTDLDEVSSDFGKMSLQSKTTWVFPENIVEAESKLKKDKELSIQLGTAISQEGEPFAVFRLAKTK